MNWGKRETEQIMLKISLTYQNHHTMAAIPSETDNRSERAFLLYCILGKINKIFPDLYMRTCYKGQHIKINPTLVFDNKYLLSDITAYSLTGVTRYEQLQKGNDDIQAG